MNGDLPCFPHSGRFHNPTLTGGGITNFYEGDGDVMGGCVRGWHYK